MTGPILLRTCTTDVDLATAYGVLRDLRSELTPADFRATYDQAHAANAYQITGAFDGGECVAVMGWRILHDFVHGKHLYVDDLVTIARMRSKGIGAMLLRHAEAEAQRLGCRNLRLCTGVNNYAGKLFYEREGWELRAVAYKKKV